MKFFCLILFFLISCQARAGCPTLKGTYSCSPYSRIRISEKYKNGITRYTFQTFRRDVEPKSDDSPSKAEVGKWDPYAWHVSLHPFVQPKWIEVNEGSETFFADGQSYQMGVGHLSGFTIQALCEDDALWVETIPPSSSFLPFQKRQLHIQKNTYGGIEILNKYENRHTSSWVEENETCSLVVTPLEESNRSEIEMLVYFDSQY